jgi:uncharacterized protein with HEPN domain
MALRDWKIRIKDILDSSARIQEYTDGLSYEQFQADKKTIDAVLRNLEIIGEAVRFVPEEIQEKYSQIPWAEMRAMRNIVAHEYFGINLRIIWHTARNNIPPIVPDFKAILEKE